MEYYALGLMSGSSLDGLDIAYCFFDYDEQEHTVRSWKLLDAQTLVFSDLWKRRLRNLPEMSALILAKTDVYFGYYMAELVEAFIEEKKIERIDYIASHGHTVFHQPEKRFTLQIGDGAALAASLGCTVINDFRGQDIALDGEGAPLAPLADLWLFPGFAGYLNIGGICNISLRNKKGNLRAADIGPGNQVLNALVEPLGIEYDAKGALARKGQPSEELLRAFCAWPYLHRPWPKSLGNEDIREQILPLFRQNEEPVEDLLATAVVAQGIALEEALKRYGRAEGGSILCTGGGVHNSFLMESLADYAQNQGYKLEKPSDALIDYKEALLMALLGLLRLQKQPNSLAELSGARQSSVNGALHYAQKKAKF